jgi:hypothetical protein
MLNQKRCHGKKSMLLHSLITGTGETLTTLTSLDGQKINTFLNIAVHAGLKLQPHLLEIDSTFFLKTKTLPLLIYQLKLSLTAKLVALATVVTHQVFTNMLLRLVSQMSHVSNTLPKTSTKTLVKLLIFARTVEDLLPMLETMVKRTAGLLTTRNILFHTITVSQVPTR